MSPEIMLRSGHYFSFTDLNSNKYLIGDIAWALANLCRFCGHSSEFYSVAQHSVYVSRLVPQHLAFEALLHDASEAYLGEVTAPLKMLLPKYKELETAVSYKIYDTFGVRNRHPDAIKKADLQALAKEKEVLLSWDKSKWEILQDIETPNLDLGACLPPQR